MTKMGMGKEKAGKRVAAGEDTRNISKNVLYVCTVRMYSHFSVLV